MIKTKVKSPPPPTPWNARKMIKLVIFVANADPSEKTKNIAIQHKSVAFLPKISDSLPHTGSVAVVVRR